MKKSLFFLVSIICLFFTVQAGYIIRGINTIVRPDNLKNLTLSFDNDGPVSAASMYSSLGGGNGRNTIVIVPSDPLLPATYFPLSFTPGQDQYFNIVVRDFHYVSTDDKYVLCGSREVGSSARAFVAVIEGDLSSMHYMEYSEATAFYSILTASNLPYSLNFYACGKRDRDGIIAYINGSTLHILNLQKTENWEYHKVISFGNIPENRERFVASGRDFECENIGFTAFSPAFSLISSLQWEQPTDPASLCVVANNILENNSVVLASSLSNRVTLTPVTIIPSPLSGTSYHFNFGIFNRFYVQDIELFDDDSRISVAGYMTQSMLPPPSQPQAWYGEVAGLPPFIPMQNKNYNDPTNYHEHHKIKYHNNEIYTGGYFQGNNVMCALFGTPRVATLNCDNLYPSSSTNSTTYYPFVLPIGPIPFDLHPDHEFDNPELFYPPYNDECLPFRGEGTAPEMAIGFENESEITTYYDRISVKDIPVNTNYQIYTVTGQLIQAGVTTPDISTAQLSKGFYILRLENGKAFKFVK